MSKEIIFQLTSLVKSKPSLKERIYYICLGVIYFIPLFIEQTKHRGESDDELLGDDIYPLF